MRGVQAAQSRRMADPQLNSTKSILEFARERALLSHTDQPKAVSSDELPSKIFDSHVCACICIGRSQATMVKTLEEADVSETEQTNECDETDDDDECKIFVTRIPTSFDEAAVKRLLEERLGEGSVAKVALIYPQDEDGAHDKKANDKEKKQDHRGFAFVTLSSNQRQQEALALGTVRGGRKAASTKKHTLYLRPVVRSDGEQDELLQQDKQLCFLWTNKRCPYGDDCKFVHQGEGACVPAKSKAAKTTRKCFAFKKGKCTKGDECPFSHEFEVTKKKFEPREVSEKDCISWKTKGKCSKGVACPYSHDEAVRTKALEKKKRKHQNDIPKERQPLSVRVFGLNYDTTESDVLSYFQHCGPIRELTFPKFDDSGRSKGYCGILFQSPKAVANAVELDGKELHGRWLRVQAGKMYLKQWEEQHESRKKEVGDGCLPQEVGEFGQKVKKRKHHGFKE